MFSCHRPRHTATRSETAWRAATRAPTSPFFLFVSSCLLTSSRRWCSVVRARKKAIAALSGPSSSSRHGTTNYGAWHPSSKPTRPTATCGAGSCNSRPRPHVRCVLSPWSFVHLVHPTLTRLLRHRPRPVCAVRESRRQLHLHREQLVPVKRAELAVPATSC